VVIAFTQADNGVLASDDCPVLFVSVDVGFQGVDTRYPQKTPKAAPAPSDQRRVASRSPRKLPAPLQLSASGRADPDRALPECLDSRAVVQCRHRALGAPCHHGGHVGPVVHRVLPVPGDARR